MDLDEILAQYLAGDEHEEARTALSDYFAAVVAAGTEAADAAQATIGELTASVDSLTADLTAARGANAELVALIPGSDNAGGDEYDSEDDPDSGDDSFDSLFEAPDDSDDDDD